MYEIEYGELKVFYKIESDGEKNTAIIIGFDGKWDGDDFDYRDINDIKFHCESDFSDRVYKHYMETGETL